MYGLGMGAVYARAMGGFASRRPTGAYAIVLLVQLMLATLLSLVLPELAGRMGLGRLWPFWRWCLWARFWP
jgi:hypothetical protein